jgi:predicted TIM-barrel fold metal-dependent hydrolase
MARRRIIDAHHHLWNLTQGYNYPWLQDRPLGEGMLGDLAPIATDYLPEAYLADSAGYDLVKSVHVEAVPRDALQETRWLSETAGRANIANAIVAHADLNAPDLERQLAAQAAFANVKGVRQIVNWHPDARFTFKPRNLLTDSAWLAGYGLLKKYGLSFDLQLYANQMEAAADLAQRHPQTLVIINHAGMPVDRDPDGITLWRNGMKRLASLENVVAKISGLGMVERNWTVDSIRPFVRHTIDCFGPGRVMFGSNFPVDKLYSSFDTLYAAFETITADLSESDRDRLFYANALAHYRL